MPDKLSNKNMHHNSESAQSVKYRGYVPLEVAWPAMCSNVALYFPNTKLTIQIGNE